jgi:hypothetical protein
LTSQHADERDLRAALAPYVADAHTSTDLYAEVLRWHRRRLRIRRGLVAGVVAVAAVGGTVIATSLPYTPAPTTSQPAPVYTHPNGVRGSLGGNQQLIDDAAKAARAEFAKDRNSRGPSPDRITPVLAERSGQATVVLFTGTSRAKPDWVSGVVAYRIGTQRWLIQFGGGVHKPTGVEMDTKALQKYYGDPVWVASVSSGGDTYAAIIVPASMRATVSLAPEVAVDGSLHRRFRPLELHAGTALVRTTGGTVIRISRGNAAMSAWTEFHPSFSPRLTDEEVAAAASMARGHADLGLVRRAPVGGVRLVRELAGTAATFRVIWGGQIAGNPCVLTAVQFASGALLPDLVCKAARSSTSRGTVPAGTFDRTALAWSSRGHAPYYVMAPPGAVRAEFVYAGRTVPVSLDNGFGRSTDPGKATAVRLYDAGGNLVEERAMDQGIFPVH